ncbi:acetoacetate--CoA ligase [Spongorhabdus nitratireducens]
MSQPLWSPSEARQKDSNMYRFMQQMNAQHGLTLETYDDLHQWSVDHRADFWQAIAEQGEINFHQPYDTVLDETAGPMTQAKWFSGSRMNFAERLLQRRDEKAAMVFRGENGTRQQLTYAELYLQVAQAQAGLKQAGIQAGDRVAAFMPNCIETVVCMLATTALGGIWTSCSPDFGLSGVLDRFGQTKPKVLISCDGYFYNGKSLNCLDKVAAIQEGIDSIEQTVVVPFRNPEPDLSDLQNAVLLGDFKQETVTDVEFASLPFDHPLYILYSSGTTGKPKCIVHGTGGVLLQHWKELALHTDVKPDDVLFYFTTCGWMMWNWLVSGLMTGATLVLFDGSPFHPGPQALLNVIQEEGITIFGTSARYIAALQKAGVEPARSHDMSTLKAVLSTGSPLAPENFAWVYREMKTELCLASISGGTDIVSCFALGSPMKPVYTGELQCAGLGMDVAFFDEDGKPVKGERGELVCRQSFPSMPVGFWNDPEGERYHNAYFARFENIWAHGDFGELTEHNGIVIHGRSDAVLNPGGVRIGTAEIYRQVSQIEDVQESLAVGQEWKDDTRIILFVMLKDGKQLTDQLKQDIKQILRTQASPRHVPAHIIQVPDLPRTLSGKLVELAVRETIHRRPVKNTDALANPESLKYFQNLALLA